MYFVIYFFIDFESFQKFNFFQFQNIFLDLYILYAQTMFIYGGNKKIQIIFNIMERNLAQIVTITIQNI